MLTAWIICSTLLGLAAMFAELRKGANVVTAVAGFVCTFSCGSSLCVSAKDLALTYCIDPRQ